MSIFQKVDFKSHAGLDLSWKIECDEIFEDLEQLFEHQDTHLKEEQSRINK